jgi:hypothetical protein
VDPPNNESNSQRIARREDRIASFGKQIEVPFNQNRTESPETYDLSSRIDRATRCPANSSDVVVHAPGIQSVGRNKGVDVDAARFHTKCGRDLDVTHHSGRNPRKDVPDLVVRQGHMLRSTQHREHIRRRPPTLLMPDQREVQTEIELDRSRSSSYIGN